MNDKRLPWLVKRLLEAMKSALSGSDEVARVIEDVKTCGYKALLVMDVVLQPAGQDLPPVPPTAPTSPSELGLTANDITWLKSLRIEINPEPR